MKKQFRLFYACASILALTLWLTGSSLAADTTSTVVKSSNETCLGCHGPYEKLISATANYKMPRGGEKMSPHVYEPHNTKDIPECINCHKPHPVPLTSKEGLPKPNVDWCYACHHTGTLTCGGCHGPK